MADLHTKEQRSYNMSRIKGKNTKPEMVVRRFLHAEGFRYRLHDPNLPGKPDIVLPKYKTVIFVHGCFWHGHRGCKLNRLPKKNIGYWLPKIQGNSERDKKHLKKLRSLSYRVIIVWECELTATNLSKTLNSLIISINPQNGKN